MPETVPRNRARTDAEPAQHGPEATTESTAPDADGLLSVLGDDSAREILMTISDESLPAREIADRLDLSRPTVYRRLDRLETTGIVETSLAYDPDGHHRKQFRATLDQVVLSVDSDRIAVEFPT